jgi:molybdenum cofactor biosynthesis enzyme MoaA
MIGRKLNRLGTLIISLAGGEPLIRRDLPEIIRALAEENHFPILITMAGSWMSPLAGRSSTPACRRSHVSVDYADPKRHDAQRGCEVRGTAPSAPWRRSTAFAPTAVNALT